MMRDPVEILEVPADVYEDMLEVYPAPSWLGMLMYNDLLAWVQQNLAADRLQEILHYAEELNRQFARRAHAALPPPFWGDTRRLHRAERVAQNILEMGMGNVWGSVVASLLEREAPRSLFARNAPASASRFTIGAYSHGPFTGLCRQTPTHPNTAKLLNRLPCPSLEHYRASV
eukprot:s660_g2.t1